MRVASGIALVVCIGTAEAGPTRKVPVESDPKGATVYVNDIDSGVACESTPCKIDAPIGKATIIVRKDGYNPEVTEIDTPRSGKIKTVKVELSSAVGTVIVEAAAFKGGKIIIDDVEKGTAPARIDVEAGTHTLKVVVKGKEVVADAFDLESASEHEVKPEEKAPQPPKVATAGFDDDDGEAKPRGVIEAHVDETKQADDAPHAPWLNLGADLDVGFRQFAYDHAGNGLSPTENESGQSMLGPTVEIWPMVLADGNHLRGLSLYGKVGFGINHQAILDSMNQPVGPTTFWGTIEADVRHRWMLGGSSITVEGGFVRDQLQFNAASKQDLKKVPVVDYKSVQLGVRGSTMLGPLEAFVAVDGRIVLSGGELATRFASADLSGVRGVVGFGAVAGPLYLRAQAAINYYSWTFTPSSDPMAGTADGATDKIEVLSFVVGLAH